MAVRVGLMCPLFVRHDQDVRVTAANQMQVINPTACLQWALTASTEKKTRGFYSPVVTFDVTASRASRVRASLSEPQLLPSTDRESCWFGSGERLCLTAFRDRKDPESSGIPPTPGFLLPVGPRCEPTGLEKRVRRHHLWCHRLLSPVFVIDRGCWRGVSAVRLHTACSIEGPLLM